MLVLLVEQSLLVSTSQRPKEVVYFGEIIHTTAVLTEASDISKGEILERKTKPSLLIRSGFEN